VSDALDLSGCLRLPVRDAAGRPLGRIADIEVEASERFPRVVALRIERGREVTRVPWQCVERVDARGAVVQEVRDGAQFPYGRILRLGRDVLDAQVVDLAGKRLARVGDVVLARLRRGGRPVGAARPGPGRAAHADPVPHPGAQRDPAPAAADPARGDVAGPRCDGHAPQQQRAGAIAQAVTIGMLGLSVSALVLLMLLPA
jgi:sporulation protein YlmC with PRC-barrel domain